MTEKITEINCHHSADNKMVFIDTNDAYSMIKQVIDNQEKARQYDSLDDVCGYCHKTQLSLGIKTITEMSDHIHRCKHDLITVSDTLQKNLTDMRDVA